MQRQKPMVGERGAEEDSCTVRKTPAWKWPRSSSFELFAMLRYNFLWNPQPLVKQYATALVWWVLWRFNKKRAVPNIQFGTGQKEKTGGEMWQFERSPGIGNLSEGFNM